MSVSHIVKRHSPGRGEYTHTMESREATKDATPATMMVAFASLDPVPPENVPTVVAIFSVVSGTRQQLRAN